MVINTGMSGAAAQPLSSRRPALFSPGQTSEVSCSAASREGASKPDGGCLFRVNLRKGEEWRGQWLPYSSAPRLSPGRQLWSLLQVWRDPTAAPVLLLVNQGAD